MTDEEMISVIKLLITTLNDTTWDEGHPGYSDSEPHYRSIEWDREIV